VTPVPRSTPRQRLIDAAADLFYRKGIGAVGVDLVSKAAGVSKRTLYQQFGSKEQLVAEALGARGEEVLSWYLGPGDDTDLPPRQEILAVFGRLSDLMTDDSFRGCPFINTVTELADPRHPARAVAVACKERVREHFRSQAGRGGAENPPWLASQLLALFDGAIVATVMGNPLPPDALQAAAGTLLDAQGLR
jgi:AcrR family transcriptional regulator